MPGWLRRTLAGHDQYLSQRLVLDVGHRPFGLSFVARLGLGTDDRSVVYLFFPVIFAVGSLLPGGIRPLPSANGRGRLG